MSELLDQVTVLVITYNEEDNIARTLDSVAFASRIIVVDSGSNDNTLEIIANYPQAEVLERAFTTFADQCNFGLEHVTSRWVLSLDADYVLPPDAPQAIETALKSGADFLEAGFDYCIAGKRVRGGIMPPRIVLFAAGSAQYMNDGHGHQLDTRIRPKRLPFRVRHDDRKPLQRWLSAQVTYAKQEAEKLDRTSADELGLNDRLRKLLFIAPPAVFILVYLLRGGFLSGWRGLYYAMQRFTAELLLSLYLIERRINRKDP